MIRLSFRNTVFSLIKTLVVAVLVVGTAGVGVSAASADEPHEEKGERTAAFTLNRVRLYVVYARQGEARVLLPPLNGLHSNAVINDAIDNTNKALDHIRKQWSYSDFEVMSQSPYLLQLVRAKGGGYDYMLNPDEGGVAYSSGKFDGVLTADSDDGVLNMELDVLRQQEQVFKVSMQLEPGRTLVFGYPLSDGEAIIAVLTVDAPETTPQFFEESGNSTDGSEEVTDQIHIEWDVPPRLIHSPQPVYPDIAFRAGVEGTVTLHVIIGTDGLVEEVKVASATPSEIFSEAARKAVLEWRYNPARVGDEPVKALCSQTIRFVLSEESQPFFPEPF